MTYDIGFEVLTPVVMKSTVTCFHTGILLGSFLDPEDDGDTFLRMSLDFQRPIRRYIPQYSPLYAI
jgi:hypothetical protein